MNNQKLAPILIFASLTILAPSLVSATSIDFTGMGKAEIVTVAGVRPISAWAGELTWTWLDGKQAGAADSFYSYCVDLLNNELDHQTVTISSTDAMTTPNFGAQKAAWLFNTYAATVHATGTSSMAAGLQLAIWEVLYDDGASLTGGTNFRAVTTGTYATSSAAIARGTEFLLGLGAAGESYRHSSATVLDARFREGQDQIIKSVPEPGSLALLGIGLVALVAGRRATRAV